MASAMNVGREFLNSFPLQISYIMGDSLKDNGKLLSFFFKLLSLRYSHGPYNVALVGGRPQTGQQSAVVLPGDNGTVSAV